MIRVIDEHQLADFRARELAPAAMYGEIRGDDHVALVPLPPGIGKSRAAQALVPHALEHGHDLVVYVSPTRGIIDEMQIADRLSPAAIVILKPRPAALCGPADAGWRSLERNGCAALAKSMFCQSCVENEENGGECGWPDQMHRIGPETRLVVLTEQYLLLNPLLLSQIQKRAGAKRVLAILDEALFLTAAISRRFTRAELLRFRAALAEMPETESGTKSWLDGIDFLLDEEVELTALRRFWSGSLRSASLAVQAAGHQAFGTDFRYLAPELELLNSGVASSQWRDGDIFEIAVRVETAGADVMVLAAYLDDEIVEERLARPVTRLLPGDRLPPFRDQDHQHRRSDRHGADPVSCLPLRSCRRLLHGFGDAQCGACAAHRVRRPQAVSRAHQSAGRGGLCSTRSAAHLCAGVARQVLSRMSANRHPADQLRHRRGQQPRSV